MALMAAVSEGDDMWGHRAPLSVSGVRERGGGLDGLPGWASWAGSGRLGGSVRWVSAQLVRYLFFFVLFLFFYLFSVFFLTLPFDFYSVLIQNFSVEIYKIFI